ncbi:hypothetical protein [Amycolatopsis pigmentata]|uniref:Secreted protein n=1 Tax=Amycolatopsis pigmentata TaxID=450801 RepID=A0ABW5FWS5_9PSEU
MKTLPDGDGALLIRTDFAHSWRSVALFRRLSVGAAAIAAIGASIAVGAPNATAAPAGGPFFAGVYPNMDALSNACNDGYHHGRWNACFACPDVAGQADLWVGTGHEGWFSQLSEGCRNLGELPLWS